MGNFDFIRDEWPGVHDDCARAESYVYSDPRSACIYARRAVEMLVRHLYDVLGLDAPYQDDLAARINDATFRARINQSIALKFNLLRKLGNLAAHDSKPITAPASIQALTELFHVTVWAAYHYSTRPDAVPTGARFDPQLAARSAPLTRDEAVRLAVRFKEQDEQHARALASKDELLAAHEAEIVRLRADVAAAQAAAAASGRTDNHDYSEAETRERFIDVLLREAGWALSEQRDREFEVTGMPTSAGGTGTGYVDYVLWGDDGLPLALVEAKRTSKDPQHGQHQAKLYADCLEARFGRRPVMFFTNGYEQWIWDDAAGYPPREVQGFYTRDELERTIGRRHTRLPLHGATVDADIAGRPYQVRAIRAIGDAFDRKQREALLVMATGSGKTRTVIALVDQLMKRGWVKRVLFLADRTALVTQATNAFKTHLPSVPTVNLVTEKAGDGRVFVSTYPTMLNLINETADGPGGTGRTRRFGPGYFDLVVIDEAHRSVYQKYGAIFAWFDSLLVGLTATPKDEVDRNTYRLFHLEDGVPTDAYDLWEAVAQGYLVPPKSVSVGTKFLRQGIRYVDLSEDEKDRWDALDWGDGGVPTEVDVEAINRFLFNADTVDKVLATLMTQGYKVAGADRIGKTIIFAKNQEHAFFIKERFDAAYPEYGGHLAQVITHATAYAQSLIDDFSTADKAPHIAISVDMLDTGIDVPEVVNLVFFKMVRSTSKFWQMIGRGTRLCPDLFGPREDKKDFLVFDFCGNLEFFSQNLPGSQGSNQKSLTQRLFESRLGLVTALDAAHVESGLRESTTRWLHEVVAGMNLDNVLVRPHRRQVETWSSWERWGSLTLEDSGDVLEHLAGLPSAAQDADVEAKRFDLLLLRRQLAQLDGDVATCERIREQVQGVAAALLTKRSIPSVAEQVALLDAVAGDEWWVDVTLPLLELARVRLRGLVRFIEKESRNRVYTDFEDTLDSPIEIALTQVTAGLNWDRFRAKATAYLKQHEDHVALQRLRRNKQLTPEDLSALEGMLVASGAQRDDIGRAAEQAHGLGLFIRSLVGLDRAAVEEAFADFLDGTRFTVEQVRFVTQIVDELTTNGIMDLDRLFESPYIDHAPTGPDSLFPDVDVQVLVDTLKHVRANALPTEVA